MADDKLAQKRNVGPTPVEAEPNHVREKTYEASKTPEPVQKEKQKLPENTARDKVRDEMSEATNEVKKRADRPA